MKILLPRSPLKCWLINFFLICILLNTIACGSEQIVVNPTPRPAATPISAASTQPGLATTKAAALPTIIPVSDKSTARPATPKDWQYRWLLGLPCHPPCFEGITPGRTTVIEASNLLKQNPLISAVEMDDPKIAGVVGYLDWDWVEGRRYLHGAIGAGGQAIYDPQSSTYTILAISPSFEVTFQLKEIIKVYGEPSHVVATAGADAHGNITYSLDFVYLSQGFLIRAAGYYTKPAFNEATTITGVNFFAPNLAGFSTAYKTSDYPNLLTPWQGFKSFDFYCRYSFNQTVRDCSSMLKPSP